MYKQNGSTVERFSVWSVATQPSSLRWCRYLQNITAVTILTHVGLIPLFVNGLIEYFHMATAELEHSSIAMVSFLLDYLVLKCRNKV